MNKLAKLINKLSYEELILLQKDVDSGTLEKLISKRMQELRPVTLQCPVCGATIEQSEGIKLEFGKYVRQVAHFDGVDCLKFFMEEHQLRY